MARGQTGARIVVYAFSAIFCMAGIGIAYGAIDTLEEKDPTQTILMFVMALVFFGFGLGVLLLTRAGFRKHAREEELQSAYPGEPWKWREDWADGRVRSTSTSVARFLWGFAVLWNLISTPMLLVLLPEEIIEKQNYGALIGLLFPLVGIGLIVAAVRKTIQGHKFGNCVFVMERVPGVLGGEVAGSIVVPRGLATEETLTVSLTCVNEVTRRSGKSTTTDEYVLWKTERSAVQLSPIGDGAGLGAVVRFSVPYDAKATEKISENSRILWKLEANAEVPGVDFSTHFEVPVFMTQASSPRNTEELLRSEELRVNVPAFSPETQTAVTVVPGVAGGTEFLIHPNKATPGILPTMAVFFIFAAIAVGLGYAGAPFLFPLIFGGIALLIIFLLLFGAYGESRIVVEDGHVSVRNTLFGIMHGRRMPCSSITKISVNGQGATGKRALYSITLTQNDGKTASPMQSLSQKSTADWLAEEVRKAMEPWRSKDKQRQTILS